MLKKLFIICLFSIYIPNSLAFDFYSFVAPYLASRKQSFYPHFEKFLGKKIADKFFPTQSADSGEVVMPPIPKVTMDATSTKSYSEVEENKGSEEENEKYNYAFVIELYQATRGTQPTEGEMGKWMNVLSQGGTREGVYRALVLDANYAGLENFDERPSDNSANFAHAFLEHFVGQKIAIEKIKAFNFYSLKRVCAEKALEILDEYGANKEYRASWYAILSSEMADKYPKAFKNDIRKDKSAARHKHWAMNVPFQHVKSETVIKIHSIFNYLK